MKGWNSETWKFIITHFEKWKLIFYGTSVTLGFHAFVFFGGPWRPRCFQLSIEGAELLRCEAAVRQHLLEIEDARILRKRFGILKTQYQYLLQTEMIQKLERCNLKPMICKPLPWGLWHDRCQDGSISRVEASEFGRVDLAFQGFLQLSPPKLVAPPFPCPRNPPNTLIATRDFVWEDAE